MFRIIAIFVTDDSFSLFNHMSIDKFSLHTYECLMFTTWWWEYIHTAFIAKIFSLFANQQTVLVNFSLCEICYFCKKKTIFSTSTKIIWWLLCFVLVTLTTTTINWEVFIFKSESFLYIPKIGSRRCFPPLLWLLFSHKHVSQFSPTIFWFNTIATTFKLHRISIFSLISDSLILRKTLDANKLYERTLDAKQMDLFTHRKFQRI